MCSILWGGEIENSSIYAQHDILTNIDIHSTN